MYLPRGGLRTAFTNVGAYREVGNIDHAELMLEAKSRHTTQTNLGAELARSVAGTCRDCQGSSQIFYVRQRSKLIERQLSELLRSHRLFEER